MSGRRPHWSERIYALLLYIYPAAFRRRYGGDMRELLSDRLHHARRERGAVGVVRAWLRVLPDVLRTAGAEHIASRRRIPRESNRRIEMRDAILNDIRYALRMVRKSPVFVFVAVLVIALGSGGVTTIFSALNALLLRPLPHLAAPDRLVTIQRTMENGNGSLSASHPYFSALGSARTLSHVAAWTDVSLSIGSSDDRIAARGNLVSGNYFDALGVKPALGRFFLAEEDQAPLTHAVIVVSHAFWHERLGADSALIGRTLHVNGRPWTLVGVAPRGFHGLVTPLRVDAWVPLMMQGQVRPGDDMLHAGAAVLSVFGRLRDGVSYETARAELRQLSSAFAASSGEPESFRAFDGVRVTALTGIPAGDRRGALGVGAILLALALLVLLIACVNVAAMLSARAIERRREMAVRAALGAGRARLVTQLLIETLLLFALGTAAGLLLVYVATAALEHVQLPGDLPIALELSPDRRVLFFALLLALASGVIFGLAPALRAAQPDVAARMREGSAASGSRRSRLSSTLVIAQLALSVVLLVAAGLLARALGRGLDVDPGFDPAGVATATLDTRSWGYDEVRGREFYRQLRERLEAQPGVIAVSATSFLPLSFSSRGDDIDVAGTSINVSYTTVDDGYFETLQLPVQSGRTFTAEDDEGAPRVAIINETLARSQWPDGDAIGATFTAAGNTVRVIGIARDAKYARLNESTPPFVYFPMAQQWEPAQTILVRTSAGAPRIASALIGIMHDIDPALPPPSVSALARVATVTLLPQRLAARITAVLGALGLLLASVGLYGVMSWSASRRSREISVRMAIGAHRGDVLTMLIREGIRLAAVGIAIGLLLAAVASRLLVGLLFGLSPLDPVTFGAMTALFLLVTFVASWLPARRAADTQPMSVLRAE